MKLIEKCVLIVFLVGLIGICVATCSQARADELESALQSDHWFHLKDHAIVSGMNLDDELTRDEAIEDLEVMMEAQEQEDFLISIMTKEDQLNSGIMSSENYQIENGHFGTFGAVK